jgi:hypothetical protein
VVRILKHAETRRNPHFDDSICSSRQKKFHLILHLTDSLAAMTIWAAKDLPARLLAAQVAKLLNCTTDDVAILVSAGKLRALGKPKQNAVKYFRVIAKINFRIEMNGGFEGV